jgi:pyruvate/2-oxoglutarate dehydrogenase complex dihydrolipoamide acyltransferase (E2) component
MLKEILIVSGNPGLYKLVSKGNNLLIIESLIDKKRSPAYPRDKVISLGDISIYADDEEVPVGKVLTAIKEKENGGDVSIDILKAQPDDLRAYFAEILPNFDRGRVYPSDIKKILKWYGLLMSNNITEFLKKEENKAEDEEVNTEDSPVNEDKAAVKTKVAAPVAAKQKAAPKTITAAKTPKTKSAPKTSTPKKNIVGAKRGG